MPSDPSFVAHAVDLVSLLGPVDARAMFGGHGLYAEGVMFALLDDGELFVKTDEETRATFVDAGCRQWTYVNKKVRMENTGYFRPPDEAHEDPEAMLPWARLALGAALRARAAKAVKAGRRPAKRKAARRTGRAQGQPDEAAPARQRAPDAERGFAAGSDLERAGRAGGREPKASVSPLRRTSRRRTR